MEAQLPIRPAAYSVSMLEVPQPTMDPFNQAQLNLLTKSIVNILKGLLFQSTVFEVFISNKLLTGNYAKKMAIIGLYICIESFHFKVLCDVILMLPFLIIHMKKKKNKKKTPGSVTDLW